MTRRHRAPGVAPSTATASTRWSASPAARPSSRSRARTTTPRPGRRPDAGEPRQRQPTCSTASGSRRRGAGGRPAKRRGRPDQAAAPSRPGGRAPPRDQSRRLHPACPHVLGERREQRWPGPPAAPPQTSPAPSGTPRPPASGGRARRDGHARDAVALGQLPLGGQRAAGRKHATSPSRISRSCSPFGCCQASRRGGRGPWRAADTRAGTAAAASPDAGSAPSGRRSRCRRPPRGRRAANAART